MDLRLQLRLRAHQRRVPDLNAARLPLIRVACGVLQRSDGSVLLTQRPAGKIAAGRWEFPGGKIEAGETALQALDRELHEELGVRVAHARRLLRLRHDYSDRIVDLDTWLVSAHHGEPSGREGQDLCWLPPDAIPGYPVLPTVAPILASLLLPEHYVFTPPDLDAGALLAGLPALPDGALLRLRLPALTDSGYRQLAQRCIHAAGRRLRVVLDRQPELALQLGAAGWHASQAALAGLSQRPVPSQLLVLASAHNAGEIDRALAVGADALVVGNLQATPSHPGRTGLGWDGFAALTARIAIPSYAIGGVGPADLDPAHAAGAQGVAGIRAWWRSA